MDRQKTARDTGLFLLRVGLAAVFVFHGGQKLFGIFGGHGVEGMAGYLDSLGIPFPTLNAYLAGGAEFFGGAALLLGIFVRLAVIPMVFTMLVASFVAHPGAFDLQSGGMEYSLFLAIALVSLGLTGGGSFSFDGMRGGRDGGGSRGEGRS